jgi:hypothetical protein
MEDKQQLGIIHYDEGTTKGPQVAFIAIIKSSLHTILALPQFVCVYV